MPYPVQHLIEDRGFPVSVKGEDSIAHALDLMIKHDFSQLPVIDEGNKPIGLITNDSILKAIKMFGVTIDKLIVTDAILKVPNYYRPEDDFLNYLMV
jgi:predicted transcriptional regulator